MKHVLLLAIIFVFSMTVSIAQVHPTFDEFYRYVTGAPQTLFNNDETIDYKGSPYANEEFVNGKLTQKDGIIFNGIPLRYNVYNDQIEFKHKSGQAFYIDKPEDFSTFHIDEQIFIFRTFIRDKKEDSGFFQVMTDDKLALLKKHRVFLKEAEEAKPYVDAKPATFLNKPSQYFLNFGGEEIFEIKSTKTIFELLNNQEKQLSKFIKLNKLKIKNETDLIHIINHYNSL